MRMWMVEPKIMCRKHLLGEHVELHMLAGSILRNKNITGFLNKGLVNPAMIVNRHQQLVTEMINRGYKHKSDLPILSMDLVNNPINTKVSLQELINRCPECRKRKR